MSDNIRGLKVEISADATKFNKGMKDVRSAAKAAQTDLATLQKSLQLEYNEKKFAEAQKAAQAAIDKTAQMADTLRARLQYLEQSGKVDTAEYQKLQNELHKTELQGQQLQKQLEQINQIKIDHFAKQFTDVGSKMQTAGKALAPFSALAAGTVTALGAAGKSAISTADEIATLATQYDMSSEALQRFNYVALQTDVSAEDLYKAFTKVRAGAADLATGTSSTASNALRQLRLDFDSFDGSEQQFYAIVDALASMTDKTQMVAIANDIFGDKLATKLLPLIYAGTDAVNEYRAEFNELGALTDEQVENLAAFDNVLNKINTQVKNAAAQIGASLLPIMQAIADLISTKLVPKLQTLANWFNGLSLGQQEFALKALLVVAALGPLTLGIGKLVTTVGSVIKMLPQLSSALSSLAAHPIILIIAAIAMILLVLYTQCEAFRESINNLVGLLGTALQPVLDVIMNLLNNVMGLLTPILNLLGGILGTIINLVVKALSPFFDMLAMIMELIGPLLEVALIPLQLTLSALSVPLQVLGTLLGWLAPLFQAFGNIVTKIFGGVVKVINFVLGFISDAINFVIGTINGLIDGVNSALGWLGVNIGRIQEVNLKINTSEIDSMDDVQATIDATPPDTSGVGALTPDKTYDQIGAGGTSGDIYNNDYSTTNTTQNVTVTIQNYAADVDVDNLVREINIKLAEAM